MKWNLECKHESFITANDNSCLTCKCGLVMNLDRTPMTYEQWKKITVIDKNNQYA